jgi:GntR family transcriptional regulator, sialic acid-inducible nan operon repressor
MAKLLQANSQQSAAPRRKRYEEIAEHIELLVFSDRIDPGGRLPSERELMERFGVGRSTVREALFKLNRMGLVELAAGAPARITRPTAKLIVGELAGVARHFLAAPGGIKHFQHARQLFEVALAREAASRANDEEIGILARALEANRGSIGDQAKFIKTDLDFHFAIAQIAKNPIFTSLMTAVDEWLGKQRAVSAQGGATQSAAYAQHAAILEAIESRDPDRAGRAMQDHLDRVAEQYWRAMANAGSSRPTTETSDRTISARG